MTTTDVPKTAHKTCLVTGASSGIGYATALELLRAGYTVYGVARRVDKMDAIRVAGGHVLAMDMKSEADMEPVVSTIINEQGRIDVLVNNSGTGLYGSIEARPLYHDHTLFEGNQLGRS